MEKGTRYSLLSFVASLTISTAIVSTVCVATKRKPDYESLASNVYRNSIEMMEELSNKNISYLTSFFYDEQANEAKLSGVDIEEDKVIYLSFSSSSINDAISALTKEEFMPSLYRRTIDIEDLIEEEYINEKAVDKYTYSISKFNEEYHISTTYLCSCGSYISKYNYVYNIKDHQIVNDGLYLSVNMNESSVLNSFLKLIISR